MKKNYSEEYFSKQLSIHIWRMKVSKWLYLITVVVSLYLLIEFSAYFKTTLLGIVVLILLTIRKVRSWKNPKLLIPVDLDTRSGALISFGYSKLLGEKDYQHEIGRKNWSTTRVIVLENEDNEKGLHFSRDIQGVIVRTSSKNFENDFLFIAQKVKTIVLFPDCTDFTIKILDIINLNDLQSKVVMVMLPEEGLQWMQLREHLLPKGYELPNFNTDGMIYHPKKNFGILWSNIFESGQVSFGVLSKIFNRKQSEVFVDIKSCIPPERNYIETYYFSKNVLRISPARAVAYEYFFYSRNVDLLTPSEVWDEVLRESIDFEFIKNCNCEELFGFVWSIHNDKKIHFSERIKSLIYVREDFIGHNLIDRLEVFEEMIKSFEFAPGVGFF